MLSKEDNELITNTNRNRSPSQKILARLDIYRVRSSHGYALAFTTSDLGSHPA